MDWFTIKIYNLPYQAYFDCDLLEESRIPTAIQDEMTCQSNWLYTNVIGGIKLQVEKNNVERALEILKNNQPKKLEVEHTISNTKYTFKCPKYKSNHIYADEKPGYWFTIPYLIFSIPLSPKNGIYHCYYCEHTWNR